MAEIHTSRPPRLSPGVAQFLSGLPVYRSAADPGSAPIFLLRTGLVAVASARRDGGWECDVLQGRPATVFAADVEVETAPDASAGRRAQGPDPRIFCVSWIAHIWDRWPGGPLPVLAHHLVQAVDPDTLIVRLTPEVLMRLCRQAHARPQGVEAGISRLVAAGLLVPASVPDVFDGPASFALAAGPSVSAPRC